MLRQAIMRGDYETIKYLAWAGEVNAYLPMADICLRDKDYSGAEFYAKKAKAAGIAGSERVFNLLRRKGYYD